MQLANQDVEAFKAKRNFLAIPEHEDQWLVPVSEVPVSYNLQARMQAAADKTLQQAPEEAAHEADPVPPRDNQPRKAKQPVRNHLVASLRHSSVTQGQAHQHA